MSWWAEFIRNQNYLAAMIVAATRCRRVLCTYGTSYKNQLLTLHYHCAGLDREGVNLSNNAPDIARHKNATAHQAVCSQWSLSMIKQTHFMMNKQTIKANTITWPTNRDVVLLTDSFPVAACYTHREKTARDTVWLCNVIQCLQCINGNAAWYSVVSNAWAKWNSPSARFIARP